MTNDRRWHFVDEWELRTLFAESGIEDAVLDGRATLLRYWRGTPRFSDLAPGTVSCVDHVWLAGRRVARVHYYESPSGDLEAGGRYDPKIIVTDEAIYALEGTDIGGWEEPIADPREDE